MSELHHLTATEQLDRLRRGELTPLELAEHYLARIERWDAELGAFATVTADAARAQARELSDAASSGSGGRASALWGLSSADKDLVARAGVRTMFGSRAFADHVPEVSDDLIRVLDEAGAISLGKTNTPEFGMPAYTESKVAPPARTPYDPRLGAGGSSGGAAVAVAAGLLPFAPGSDGGGSIRIPASATGLVGLKPSRGRIPTGTGLTALGGLPVPGVLARTVADAALLFDAMVEGGDYAFATRAPIWDGGAYLNAATRGEGRFQIGVTTWSPWAGDYDLDISDDALAAMEAAVAELSAIGHGIERFEPDPEPGYSAAFRAVWQGGASGIPIDDEHLDLVEPLTRWLIETGRRLPASVLADALRELTAFESRIIRRFSPYDAVLTPTLAQTPRPVGSWDLSDGESNFAQQVLYTPFTSFVNVAGLPAISLPVHVTAGGLPMGAQLVGRPGGEHTLLALGAQLERRLHWQHRHPPQF